MSKKQSKVLPFVPASEAKIVPPVREIAAPTFSFPTRSRCPRCASTNTIAVSTQGGVQYRKCRSVVCRTSYKVFGDRI